MEQSISMVLDLGKSYLRLGYSGDDAPRVVCESYLATTTEEGSMNQEWDEGSDQKQTQTIDKFIFGDKLHDYNASYVYEPLWKTETSFSPNPKLGGLFSKEILPNMLSLESKIFPLLMSEDSNTTKEERKQLLSIFLESGITNNFMLMKQSLLTMYACGKINGTVIDSSSYFTTVSTIDEGYVVQEGYSKLNYGGEHLTEIVAEQFTKDNTNVLPSTVRSANLDPSLLDSSYLDFERRVFARKIKDSLFSETGKQDLI